MIVYIASSWRNRHAVELLTDRLEERGHRVLSFVRKAVEDERGTHFGDADPEEWIRSEAGLAKFRYDLEGATHSDLVIYVGPSGTDAWAEVGAAWASGVPILGLWARGEPAGLMRRMVEWFHDHRELLTAVEERFKVLEAAS